MKLKDFEDHVNEKSKIYKVDLPYTVIALNEEAGEVAGWYKKAVLRGNAAYTDEHLLSELGDLLFYLTKAAALKGWSLSDVMEFNVEKLVKRHGR